ncbi:MAG: Flp pilus assembly complex ATPase component TadA [Parcubacteria group bacterium]|nr:Flp pilus assembly complex ATPase component TadA [Parcubacteria group bacterium]
MAELYRYSDKRLSDILWSEGLLSAEQLSQLRKDAATKGTTVEALIVQEKLVDPEDLARMKSKILDVPYVDLNERPIPEAALLTIPKHASVKYGIVAFELEGRLLSVALTDPTNFKALEAIDFVAKNNGYQVKLFLTGETSYRKALGQYETLPVEIDEALKSVEETISETAPEFADREEVNQANREAGIIAEAPISKVTSVIIKHAVEAGASDIHIEPIEDFLRVRYRVDGILRASLTLSRSLHPAIVARLKILANMKIDETRLPQDGRFRLIIQGKEIDFRTSSLPTIHGEKIVLRILDRSSGILPLDSLGFRKDSLDVVLANLKRPYGMILLTGPTGSGKSTTLNSMLALLNNEGVNVVTLEDPVEYQIKGINQVQMKPEIDLTFASALRSVLRQDPNIIMVGEVRDRETAELAINAALTGHLVFSTLHTNSAVGAIPRLIDMNVEPFLIASAVNMVAAQRLVRRLCTACKTQKEASESIANVIRKALAEIEFEHREKLLPASGKPKIWYSPGCAQCGNEGYKGRIGLVEVFEIKDEIRDAIVTDTENVEERILTYWNSHRIPTMRQDGFIKVLAGETSFEEVLRVTT